MRILMVHNRSLKPGGEEESTALEVRMLESRGHQVTVLDESNERVASLGLIRTAARATWSTETYGRIRAILQAKPHDLLHVQNFFPLLSPAVFWAARSLAVPTVHTIRTYRIACADAFFLRNGSPCEDCLGRKVAWPAVAHGCYRSSRAGSAAVAGSQALHSALGTWRKKVDAFICLTEFARRKMEQAGLPGDRIHVKPNFLAPDPGVGSGGEGFLFVGRLSQEKGVMTLLKAWRSMDGPPRLDIVGDGPLAAEVRAAAGSSNEIRWLGRLPLAEVVRRMGGARAVVFPSEWYETFGRVGAEAMATGTPVLASRIGALEEMVVQGHNGLFFEPGNPQDLAACVQRLRQMPADPLRAGARATFEERYTEERNYKMLMGVYDAAITRSESSPQRR